MKKFLKILLIVGMLSLTLGVFSGTEVLAHRTGPCNDSDGDGSFSGFEYAMHHIVEFARAGLLGQFHKPGSHHGFSICL